MIRFAPPSPDPPPKRERESAAGDGSPPVSEAPDAADPAAPEAASGGDLLLAGVEALLFSHGAPVSLKRLAAALPAEPEAVLEAVRALERRCSGSASGLRLARIAGGFQLTTGEEWRSAVERLLRPRRRDRLSEAALETLSVIAYRQPITLPELNALRGVRSQGVVGTLLKHRLIRTRGRKKVVGRPLLYGTTKEFLERFGLDRLDDLPRPGELEGRETGVDADLPPAPVAAEPVPADPASKPRPERAGEDR